MKKYEFLVDFCEKNPVEDKMFTKICQRICANVTNADERTALLMRMVNAHPKKELCILPIYYTDELIKLILDKQSSLVHIPVRFYTPELIKCAVQINGSNLGFAYSIEERTKELCDLAFEKNTFAIIHIPDEYKTEAMCLEAVRDKKNRDTLDKIIEHGIPKEFYSVKLFLAAVETNPSVLKYVPLNYRTYDVCLEAVSQCKTGECLGMVPKNLIDEKMCKIAMRNTPFAFGNIPNDMITEDMCRKAVAYDCNFLDLVPDKFKSEKLYEIAYENHTSDKFIHKIPDEYKTFAMCSEAVKASGDLIKYVPKKYIDTEFVISAIKHGGLKDIEDFLDTLPEIIREYDFFYYPNENDNCDDDNEMGMCIR